MSVHFEDKDAASHIVQKRIEGFLTHTEAHGEEIPGHISAAADTLRESGVVFSLLFLIMTFFSFPIPQIRSFLFSFMAGWIIWKTGRSAWLGWSRLWRLHRIIEQEKYEIEHNRSQEKEELAEMYRLKGFEGKLLEDVVEVLTADQDRLLKVMLEEELGLTLEAYQHPLKQALGAFLGTLSSSLIATLFLIFLPSFGMLVASLLLIGWGSVISARQEKNNQITAIIWNTSIAALALGSAYFIINLLKTNVNFHI